MAAAADVGGAEDLEAFAEVDLEEPPPLVQGDSTPPGVCESSVESRRPDGDPSAAVPDF